MVTGKRRYLFYVEQNYAYAILRPLQDEIRRRGDDVAWFLVGDEINSGYLREDEKQLQSVAEVLEYAPRAVFVPGNLVPAFIPGLKVKVFHGFNAGKVNRRGKVSHFTIRGCFDLYCTLGPDNTVGFTQLAEQHGHFRVIETGWPMLDPLFTPAAQEKTAAKPRNREQRPTILLCSTFSRRFSCAPVLYETIRQLREDDRWQWLVQFHPKMDPTIVASYKALQNDNLRFVETDNVIPLLQQADVMVCDTSSVLQMFLLQQKPVVTLRNNRPGSHLIDIQNPDDLVPAIERALDPDPELTQAIKAYIQHLHPYNDGHSSERVLTATEAVLQEQHAIKRKPLNLLRRLKIRRQLNYFGAPYLANLTKSRQRAA